MIRTIKNKLNLFTVTALALFLFNTPINAATFVVKHIKIVGLQRISTGTVLNYLPIQEGEELNLKDTASIIKTLYDTGFFQSVVLERQGDTLVVEVVERETIGSIVVNGNKELPEDTLKNILKEYQLVKGRIFQRSSLEHLEKELKQTYNVRGKYNASVTTKVTKLKENRVAIVIDISEGRASRIKKISIVGNHDFSEKELLSELALSSTDVFTYFTKKDQYSKPAMDASLEALRSFYLDRGYLKFSIISSQVSLTPDKKDVYININIHEGPQYKFSGYSVEGRPILSNKELEKLISIKKGDVFSRKLVTESISEVSLALGDLGYGFPAINADPKIDENNKTVFIKFMVDPGRRIYVRRVQFHGNTKTGDYVLRNMIRQDEGSLISLHNIKESERQLRLLSYLKNVNVKTTPVSGSNNQVDLDVNVEEASSADASASVGYGTTGPDINAAFNQHNFMGTGKTVGLSFNANYWGQNYSGNYYNPFYTNTGIGRGISGYFQNVNPTKLDVSAYTSSRFGGDVTYNILLSENSNIALGYGYQGLNIRSVGLVQQIQNFVNLYGRDFNEIRLNSALNHNTYDQMPYPNKGTNQQLTALVALQATKESFNYFKLGYMGKGYLPLYKGFILTGLANVDYGNTFNRDGLPFYENYFAGGIAQPGQVRGYESFSLGPQDNQNNSMGANLLINGMLGVILPYPLSRDNVRTTIFSDAGNVFSMGTPVALRGTDAGPMRYSAGVSLEWRSPMGPLAFSVARALNKQPSDGIQYFQFTMSSSF